jgi:hypothetical protein
MHDLFGEVPVDATPAVRGRGPQGGKHYTKPAGYIRPPGTGPKTQTCGSCTHIVRCGNYGGSKQWLKCGLMQPKWTHGRGSDVLARSPACSLWKEIVTP